jgi:S1-C subfamily serine protease
MLERLPGRTLEANSIGSGTPYIGVALQALDENVRGQIHYYGKTGVVVSAVFQGTPADKAGLQAGDVITSIDGEAVSSPDELTKAIHALKPGRTVALQVSSSGREKLVTVKIGDAPSGFGQESPNAGP